MTVGIRLTGVGWHPYGRDAPVLCGVDLAIGEGERVGIVGPSGAGKSTLLHAIAGVLGDTQPGDLTGTVETAGRVGLMLQDPSSAAVADRIGRDVAFGPENIALAKDEIWSRVRTSLDRVGLHHDLSRSTSALSGGERQRLALAGMLALEPRVLLLDEATSMLDPDQATQVRGAVLDTVTEERSTLVVVDHHIGGWLPHLDRVIWLTEDASLIEVTDPSRLVSDHGAALTAAGIWLPGTPAPEPVSTPAALVTPESAGPTLTTQGLGIDLVNRRLRGTTRTTAVDRVELTVPGGRLTALTGPSGVGKSTVLAALAGLISPTRGAITGTAESLSQLGSSDLARIVGWVPQTAEHGFVTTSVREEVAFTAARLGRAVSVDDVLGHLRLTTVADANPYRISGGEQRRLALAAALAHRPSLVTADEPTVGQDRHTWAAVVGWLRSAAEAGATVVAATHDRELVAVADRRLELGLP